METQRRVWDYDVLRKNTLRAILYTIFLVIVMYLSVLWVFRFSFPILECQTAAQLILIEVFAGSFVKGSGDAVVCCLGFEQEGGWQEELQARAGYDLGRL